MKHNTYQITFDNGKTRTVYAFNEMEAIIKAQAAQIHNGESYTVKSLMEVKK